MIFKEIIGNELYVYINGSLAYKRWIKQAYGIIFCPIFKAFRPKDRDKLKE